MSEKMSEIKEKQYTKAVIHTTTQGAEALGPLLARFGIDALCVEDPADLNFIRASAGTLYDYIDESLETAGGQGEVRVTFYIPSPPEAETATDQRNHDAFLEGIRIALMQLKSGELYGDFGPAADFGRLWMETEKVKDDWSNRYKETFHAFSPCPGVRIRPPWEPETEKEPGVIEIVIDPGMAFGTGTHETTSLCLGHLLKSFKAGDSLLDAGTGSGILAIAAALWGRSDFVSSRCDKIRPSPSGIVAVELDPNAIASARENIRRNGCADRIRLVETDILSEGALGAAEENGFTLITANLTKKLLLKLLPRLWRLLRPGGVLLLSGLLDAQTEEMAETLRAQGFSDIEADGKGEWALLEARKPQETGTDHGVPAPANTGSGQGDA